MATVNIRGDLSIFIPQKAFALTSVSVLKVISVRFGAFLTFESCVGAFWPLMAGLRSKLVPEDSRCAVLSLFRFDFLYTSRIGVIT